jgi:hypothetical protein
LPAKRQRAASADLLVRCQFAQQRLADDKVQTGIAAFNGMTNPIGFGVVEEQHLIGFGHGIVTTQMAHKHAAIWKDQMRHVRAFFYALVPACAAADDILDRDGRRPQERLCRELRHGPVEAACCCLLYSIKAFIVRRVLS